MAKRKFVHIDCEAFHTTGVIKAGTAITGADTSDTIYTLGQHSVIMYNQGANTRLNFVPVIDANCQNGLELPSTNTDNIGMTMCFGSGEISNANHPGCFTVGTDPAFYCKCKIGIPDISDYDIFFFGFVEPATFVDNIEAPADVKTAYDEKAGWSLADNAGDIDIDSSVAGSDVNTDTTTTDWVDDAVKTLEVDVGATGAVTYRLWAAGVEDTSTGAAAVSLADATVVQPVIILGSSAGAAADTPPILNYIEWGYQ